MRDDIATLCRWIEQESPTRNPASVDAMGDLTVAEAGEQFVAERIDSGGEYGRMVILRAGPENGKKPILLIGHLDTVHPWAR